MVNFRNSCVWLFALGFGGAIGGCAGGQPPEAPPPTASPPPSAANAPGARTRADGDAAAERVAIDERIKKLCQLPAEQFDFNSAALSPAAAKMLAAVAECFETGPGKGANLAIVGHADARGEEE